jgi:hypothetical protein
VSGTATGATNPDGTTIAALADMADARTTHPAIAHKIERMRLSF